MPGCLVIILTYIASLCSVHPDHELITMREDIARYDCHGIGYESQLYAHSKLERQNYNACNVTCDYNGSNLERNLCSRACHEEYRLMLTQ